MSLAALTLVLGYLAMFGITEPQADEGTAAHLFQLLLAGQIPIAGFFALRWLPRMPGQASQVLALQIFAALVPFALVFFLEG